MKKIALLLCLILCFGVLVSCKASENDKKDEETIKDDGNQAKAETYEVNIRKSFYLSEDVFVANVLNYEESERSVNVKVRIQEVFKGNCDIGQIMDLKLEGRQDTQFSEIIKEGESEFDCLFMLGHDSWAEHNLNENEKQRRRSIANHTVRIFKVSDDGLIRLNYGSKMVWLNSYDVRKIPESIEDMVQQVFMYKPLVIYLKQRLGTNSIGVLGKAENVFIGEIQPIDRALFEEIRGFQDKGEKGEGCFGEKVEGTEFIYYGRRMVAYKVKVKVTNVYKGNYKQGDIVESYVFVNYDMQYDSMDEYVYYMNDQLFIDGEGFFNK